MAARTAGRGGGGLLNENFSAFAPARLVEAGNSGSRSERGETAGVRRFWPAPGGGGAGGPGRSPARVFVPGCPHASTCPRSPAPAQAPGPVCRLMAAATRTLTNKMSLGPAWLRERRSAQLAWLFPAPSESLPRCVTLIAMSVPALNTSREAKGWGRCFSSVPSACVDP